MLRRWLPRVALLAFSLLVLELLLHGMAGVSQGVAYLLATPWERDVPILPDAVMVHAGNRRKSDHDRAGYRNAAIPSRAEVVVFGDSQSYGTGVTREQAWPAVLAQDTGASVYSMALPGYGAAHAAIQLERALELQPRYLLASVYFGNDLYDGFALARVNPAVAALVPEEVHREADAVERAEPLTIGFETLFGRGMDQVDAPQQEVARARRWISDHSALYGLLRSLRARFQDPPPAAVLTRDFETAVAALDPEQLAWFSPFDAGDGWRTILTARYRARVMDLEDARLDAGFEAAVGALLAVDHAARAANARPLVVLIPTKEFVFASRVPDPARHVGLVDLLARETSLRSELVARLERQDIEVLDLAEVLRAQAENPYFEDADGHPNARGHAQIARAVRERLQLGTPGR